MILATYATFQGMHGRRSSIQELIERLCPYSRESVFSLSSFIGILLKLWDRGDYDLERYDHLISCAFEALRGDWYKLAARLSDREVVFHRRQLLLIIKIAVLHCPEVGANLWNAPPGFFGTILLIANDHFHYDLSAETKSGELDKVKRLFTELIPVGEGAGFRPEHKIVRSRLMLNCANKLRSHPEFLDVEAGFQTQTGISLFDYEALCFGLFAKCATLSPEALLQAGSSAFTIAEQNFHAMSIPKRSVTLFLKQMTTTPELLAKRITQRDYGPNDFTELRKRPLISASNGYLPIDILFLVEKFETGPYWVVNDISKNIGDQLRRFWGAVFEVYMNDLLGKSLAGTRAVFITDPRSSADPSRQICDALILQGDTLVLLEYKSSMFRAETKYSGNYELLINEIEKKLVRDKAESKKKGVEQLADAVLQLFSDEAKPFVRGIDLTGVKRVYPLLVTFDGIGGSLLISKLLNHYFSTFVNARKFRVEVKPLFCTDVESIEEVSGCFEKMSLPEFLDFWLSKDPNFIASLTAFTVPELEGNANQHMAREWHSLSNEISQRAFPKEHAAAKKIKNTDG